jgi:hypothetical protein
VAYFITTVIIGIGVTQDARQERLLHVYGAWQEATKSGRRFMSVKDIAGIVHTESTWHSNYTYRCGLSYTTSDGRWLDKTGSTLYAEGPSTCLWYTLSLYYPRAVVYEY